MLGLPPALKRLSDRRLESEPRVELNLTSGADGGEYSADVFGEITCSILENGVSVSSEGKRTLRVARHGKIRMVEEIVGFRSEGKPRAFGQLETLLQRQIKLREPWSAQDVSSSIAELTGRG